MKRELIPQLDALLATLGEWRGSWVEVVEQISRSPGTLDRHFTTTSQFVLLLRTVAITFSGATLLLDGEVNGRPAMYQATCDLLDELSLASAEIVFVEQYGKAALRRSTFRRVDDTPGA